MPFKKSMTVAIGVVFIICHQSWGSDAKNFSVTTLLGIPHPLNLGLDYRAGGLFSGGISGGLLAFPISSSDGTSYTFGISNLEARFRLHPFSGSFFLGVAAGYQTLNGSGTQPITVNTVTAPITINATIHSWYVSPHLGWFWVFTSGFTLGIEAGIQLPVSASSQFDASFQDPNLNALLGQVQSTPQYQQLYSDLQNAGDKIGKLNFPYVTVLRIGWSF